MALSVIILAEKIGINSSRKCLYKLTYFLLDRKILKKSMARKKTFEKYAKSLVANFNFSSDDPNTRAALRLFCIFFTRGKF